MLDYFVLAIASFSFGSGTRIEQSLSSAKTDFYALSLQESCTKMRLVHALLCSTNSFELDKNWLR